MKEREELKRWYDDAVRRCRDQMSRIPTVPDRYQQRFYLNQAFLRFRDYWKTRIWELEREERPDKR